MGAGGEPGDAGVVADRPQAALELLQVALVEREVLGADRVADVGAGHAVGLQLVVDGQPVLDAQPRLDAVRVLVAEQVEQESVADLLERAHREVDVVRDEVALLAVDRVVRGDRLAAAEDLAVALVRDAPPDRLELLAGCAELFSPVLLGEADGAFQVAAELVGGHRAVFLRLARVRLAGLRLPVALAGALAPAVVSGAAHGARGTDDDRAQQRQHAQAAHGATGFRHEGSFGRSAGIGDHGSTLTTDGPYVRHARILADVAPGVAARPYRRPRAPAG